jgi:hypothetical protein
LGGSQNHLEDSSMFLRRNSDDDLRRQLLADIGHLKFKKKKARQAISAANDVYSNIESRLASKQQQLHRLGELSGQ